MFIIYAIYKTVRDLFLQGIEERTFNELQNYLNASKPDKLFKRYYDAFDNWYSPDKSIPRVNNQIITIEFNENYKKYHAGKACMSDIINNLNYSFKPYMQCSEEPKLVLNDGKWWLSTKTANVDLSSRKFTNCAINFHINYLDLKQIAKTVKMSDLSMLSEKFKTLVTHQTSRYIIYDIYSNEFETCLINPSTWSEYIDICLSMHYKLLTSEPSFNSPVNALKIIESFKKISKKYDWMFDKNTLHLYNSTSNKLALPNPDGLIVNQHKM